MARSLRKNGGTFRAAAAAALFFAHFFSAQSARSGDAAAQAPPQSDQARAIEEFRKAMALITAGDRAAGGARLQQAIFLAPQWPQPRLEYAINILESGGDPRAAFEHLKSAMTRITENPRANFHLGQALERLGRDDEAVLAYAEAVSEKPSYVEARTAFGRMLKGMGRDREAREQLEAALDLAPSAVSTRLMLAEVYERLGEIENAESHLKSLIMMNPENAWHHHRLAQFYERTGRPALAREEYLRAEEVSPARDKRRLRPLLPSRK